MGEMVDKQVAFLKLGRGGYKAAFVFQPEKIRECNDYVPQCHLVVLRDRIQN